MGEMRSEKPEKVKVSDERLVLDHIENISVDSSRHTNSLNVLRSLGMGMTSLAEATRQREIPLLENQGSNIGSRSVLQFDDEALMLACVFDWFAISLVSYLRHVKLLDLMEVNEWRIVDLRANEVRKEIKRACPLYIKSVAPAVYKWRQKIAAHRAATDPNKTDNLTTLTYSTMPMISYRTPYYRAVDFILNISNGGQLDLEPWSLTETFENLAPRLWPEVCLTSLPDD